MFTVEQVVDDFIGNRLIPEINRRKGPSIEEEERKRQEALQTAIDDTGWEMPNSTATTDVSGSISSSTSYNVLA